MDKVIIDTSAWIESFRSGESQLLSLLVKDLILHRDRHFDLIAKKTSLKDQD
jgi:hypothetical protein